MAAYNVIEWVCYTTTDCNIQPIFLPPISGDGFFRTLSMRQTPATLLYPSLAVRIETPSDGVYDEEDYNMRFVGRAWTFACSQPFLVCTMGFIHFNLRWCLNPICECCSQSPGAIYFNYLFRYFIILILSKMRRMSFASLDAIKIKCRQRRKLRYLSQHTHARKQSERERR